VWGSGGRRCPSAVACAMRIGIVGPGRLGRSLAILLERAGHLVATSGRHGWPEADVVLLTVPDGAIAEAAARVQGTPVLLHCSGACRVDVLRPYRPAGSLHPLMTFPGPEVALPDLTGVPAAVAGDSAAVAAATSVATSLGMRPFLVPGDRRLYHASAVMAGNFATVLLAEAARVLTAAGVPAAEAPSILAPLAVQSLRNASDDPSTALTGPVARGDEATIERHRRALADAGLADVVALYELLTAHARRLVTREDS